MVEAMHECPMCGEDRVLKPRVFSDQAAAALLVWGELEQEMLGKPICDSCYGELREVLIDRADELETAAKTYREDKAKPASDKKPAKKVLAKKAIKKTKKVTAKAKKSKRAG